MNIASLGYYYYWQGWASGPCTDNLLAWTLMQKNYLREDGVYCLDDKMGKRTDVSLEGQCYQGDGIGYIATSINPVTIDAIGVLFVWDGDNANILIGTQDTDRTYLAVQDNRIAAGLGDKSFNDIKGTTILSVGKMYYAELKYNDTAKTYELLLDGNVESAGSYTQLSNLPFHLLANGRSTGVFNITTSAVGNIILRKDGSILHQYNCNETSGITCYDAVGGAHGTMTNITPASWFATDNRFENKANDDGYSEYPNLWDGTYQVGYITVGSTTITYNASTRTTNTILCKPNTNYSLAGGNRVITQYMDNDDVWHYFGSWATRTFTTPSDAKGFRVYYTNIGLDNLSITETFDDLDNVIIPVNPTTGLDVYGNTPTNEGRVKRGIEIIGSYYGNFDGVVYGEYIGNLYSGFNGSLEVSCKPTSATISVIAGSQDAIGARYDFLLLRGGNGDINFYVEGAIFATGCFMPINEKHTIRATYNNGDMFLYIDNIECWSDSTSSFELISGTSFIVGGDITGIRRFVGEIYYVKVNDDIVYDFSMTTGNTVYSPDGNHLTLINATHTGAGAFWQQDDTGLIEPELAIEGCGKYVAINNGIDEYLSITSLPALQDFDIEFDIVNNYDGAYQGIFGSNAQCRLMIWNVGRYLAFGGSGGDRISSNNSIPLGMLTHIRLYRTSGIVRCDINGIYQGYELLEPSLFTASSFFIGRRYDTAFPLLDSLIANFVVKDGVDGSILFDSNKDKADFDTTGFCYVSAKNGIDALGNPITIQPFDWSKLPYSFRYPSIPVLSKVMDKSNTDNWGDAGDPTGLVWSYEQLNNLPFLKKTTIENQIFIQDSIIDKPVTAIAVYSETITDPACQKKTYKWANSQILHDELGVALEDENEMKLTK